MTFEIETISTKKFILISLLSVPVIIGICIALTFIFNSEMYILLILPLLIGAFIIARKAAGQIIHIDIGSDRVSVNNRNIEYHTIQGYHINKTGLIMSSLDLRLSSNETFSITCSNFGDNGVMFSQLTENLVKAVEEKNQSFRPMIYQDVHVKQMKFLRPLIISGIVLVLILDFFAILSGIFGGKWLPWQIFMVNAVILSLLPYLKRSKTK
jgi:hypothetical protein